MKINLAKSAGFCFGVKRAIEIALRTASREKRACMLGDIVHNEEVSEKIRKAGIKKIGELSGGKGKILLIRAHGISSSLLKKAKQLGYEVVDATCPMVKEIHRIAKNAECNGRTIIVIGDKKHNEVQGIVGQLKGKAIVIDPQENIPWHKINKIKKACVVAQSTQNMGKVLKIVKILRMHIRNLSFFNTICRPTRIKQEEIEQMPKDNDVMIIIGSKTSANTKRLYQISKSLNERSYWVQSKKDIKPVWLKGVNSVGVTAGASTPDDTTEEVIAYIKKITKNE
jgi:4-hydroxy-3-methylbut-2-enyl diphosphate reductase